MCFASANRKDNTISQVLDRLQGQARGRRITVLLTEDNPGDALLFQEMLGYQSSEEVMETITDISRQIFAVPEEWLKLGNTIAEHGSAKGFETELYRKDGSRLCVSIHSQAVKDDEGRSLYLQGLYADGN